MAGIRNIFFDLDGTLTDPAEGITNSVVHALKYYNITVGDKRDLYKFIGPPLAQSFSDFYGFSQTEAARAVEKYREYFADKGIFENEVYPYVPQMLANLKSRGFCRYFDFIGGSLLDNSRTDKGEVIEYVLGSLKASRDNTIMVGDRFHDIAGAKKCSVLSAGVLYGFGSREELEKAGADYIVSTPQELEKLLISL